MSVWDEDRRFKCKCCWCGCIRRNEYFRWFLNNLGEWNNDLSWSSINNSSDVKRYWNFCILSLEEQIYLTQVYASFKTRLIYEESLCKWVNESCSCTRRCADKSSFLSHLFRSNSCVSYRNDGFLLCLEQTRRGELGFCIRIRESRSSVIISLVSKSKESSSSLKLLITSYIWIRDEETSSQFSCSVSNKRLVTYFCNCTRGFSYQVIVKFWRSVISAFCLVCKCLGININESQVGSIIIQSRNARSIQGVDGVILIWRNCLCLESKVAIRIFNIYSLTNLERCIVSLRIYCGILYKSNNLWSDICSWNCNAIEECIELSSRLEFLDGKFNVSGAHEVDMLNRNNSST